MMLSSRPFPFSEAQIQHASLILGVDGQDLRSRFDNNGQVLDFYNGGSAGHSEHWSWHHNGPHVPRADYRVSQPADAFHEPHRLGTPRLAESIVPSREYTLHARSESSISQDAYDSEGRRSIVPSWPEGRAGTSPLSNESSSILEDTSLSGPCSQPWGIKVSYRRRPRNKVTKSAPKRKHESGDGNSPDSSLSHAKRADTVLTRRMNACIRCRNQKLRCEMNPADPSGACLTCTTLTSPILPRLPCLRLKITEASLFREQKTPNLAWTDRWTSMKIENVTDWASRDVVPISITHGFQGFDAHDIVYNLELRQFVPRKGDRLSEVWSDRGTLKEHYVPPFAIANMHDAARELQDYIGKAVIPSITKVVGTSEDIYWETYQMAFRHSRESPNEHERKVLDNTLRLWTMSRITSRHEWQCSTRKVGSMVTDPSSPFYGTHPLAPVMSAQLEVICYSQFLRPLTKTVLNGLQKLVSANEHRSWFTLFLTLFILLHSCSLTTLRDAEWAAITMQGRQFANPSSIAEHHRGILTMLAHFHHANKGRHPFVMVMHPESRIELAKFAELKAEQLDFVEKLAHWAQRKQHEVPHLRAARAFGDDYYFVSQLFEEKWTPPPVA